MASIKVNAAAAAVTIPLVECTSASPAPRIVAASGF
jgi:hypothetical protein